LREVLVTGAAGFIGYHVARRLLERGSLVHGVDNLSTYYDVSLKESRLEQLRPFAKFRFSKVDLAQRDATSRLFDVVRPRVVIHLAAQAGVRHSLKHPEEYVDTNLVGFGNILEGSRHTAVEHLLFASSSSVYGANTVAPFSVQHGVDHPVSLYAATKRANELMAHAYSHIFQVPATGLRFFTVYGPWGRPDMAAFLFTKAIFEGRPIDVFNEGDMWRDFTYVDDIAEAVVRVAERAPPPDPSYNPAHNDPARSRAPFRIYNVGNHQAVRLSEFIAILERLTGREANKRYLPIQPGDVPYTCADVTDLMRDVGFAPDTPLEEGLARFVAWYRDYYGVRD
jgi:UDP-glucuronate 4-epimerase